MSNELMTQGEFAKFWGCTQPMVSRYVSQGKIPAACIKKVGKYQKIVVDCAVQALEENLSPLKRKPRTQGLGSERQEKENLVQFQDGALLIGRLEFCLDQLGYISSLVIDDIQERIDPILDELAGLFDAQMMNIEGIPGRRCVQKEATK